MNSTTPGQEKGMKPVAASTIEALAGLATEMAKEHTDQIAIEQTGVLKKCIETGRHAEIQPTELLREVNRGNAVRGQQRTGRILIACSLCLALLGVALTTGLLNGEA